jgi:monovalent cation/hydrogen antiporter
MTPSWRSPSRFSPPYAVYIPAEELGVSGVLATVAAGLYLGWRNPETTAPRNRLQSFGLWEVLPFLLNSVLFILIGLQLPKILKSISGESSMAPVILYGALVILAVVGTRLLWTFPATYLPRLLSRSVRERNPSPPWQQVAIIAYTGMRGPSPWRRRWRSPSPYGAEPRSPGGSRSSSSPSALSSSPWSYRA